MILLIFILSLTLTCHLVFLRAIYDGALQSIAPIHICNLIYAFFAGLLCGKYNEEVLNIIVRILKL